MGGPAPVFILAPSHSIKNLQKIFAPGCAHVGRHAEGWSVRSLACKSRRTAGESKVRRPGWVNAPDLGVIMAEPSYFIERTIERANEEAHGISRAPACSGTDE
jgi:hypothetical protein